MVLLVGIVAGSFCVVLFRLHNQDWMGSRVLQALPTSLVYLIAAHHDWGAGSVFNRYLLPALGALLAAGVLAGILVVAAAYVRSSVSVGSAAASGALAGVVVTGWSLLSVGVWQFGFLMAELFSGAVSSAFVALVSAGIFLGSRSLVSGLKRLRG